MGNRVVFIKIVYIIYCHLSTVNCQLSIVNCQLSCSNRRPQKTGINPKLVQLEPFNLVPLSHSHEIYKNTFARRFKRGTMKPGVFKRNCLVRLVFYVILLSRYGSGLLPPPPYRSKRYCCQRRNGP